MRKISHRPTSDQMHSTNLREHIGEEGKLTEHETVKSSKTQFIPHMSGVYTGLVWYERDNTESLWEKK